MKIPICFGIAMLLSLTGCMSDQQWTDTRLMHKEYMNQQRSFRSVEIIGNNMSITLTGVTSIKTEAPLNPLTTIPQYPEFAKDVLDGAKTVAGYAALGYIGGKAVDGLASPVAVTTPTPTP